MSILDFVTQICRILSTSGDVVKSVNTVLRLMQEYYGIRQAVFLIRDSVTNQYFVELAPELTELEKNRWSHFLSTKNHSNDAKLHHEMVLSLPEMQEMGLPIGTNLALNEMCTTICQPIVGLNRMPLGVLVAVIMDNQLLSDKVKIIRYVAGIIALSMEAHGFTTAKIFESNQDIQPMIMEGVVGNHGEMRKLAEIIRKVSTSKATVLIQGESGTGKELIARSIHQHSLRSSAPFIGLNCAALSENLLESELFGHEKGAFTGAIKDKKGRFELADGGTLFLDEIGDISLNFQTKLLRVLQEGQFERLGGVKTLTVDVRIVCATNSDLAAAIRKGSFREDLYYRLNVISLQIPALRERKEDIHFLVEYFLSKLNREYNKSVQVSKEDMQALKNYEWPGNVRELENAIHSAFLMENNNLLNLRPHLKMPRNLMPLGEKAATAAVYGMGNFVAAKNLLPFGDQTSSSEQELAIPVEQEEIKAIQQALIAAKGIQVKAAQSLNISLRQLRYRIKKYDLPVRKIGI